jgi:hypothetical protein
LKLFWKRVVGPDGVEGMFSGEPLRRGVLSEKESYLEFLSAANML